MSDLKALPAQKPLSTWGAPTPFGPTGTPAPAGYFGNNYNPLRRSTHTQPAAAPTAPAPAGAPQVNPILAALGGGAPAGPGGPSGPGGEGGEQPDFMAGALDEKGGMNPNHPFNEALMAMINGQNAAQDAKLARLDPSQSNMPWGDMTHGMD